MSDPRSTGPNNGPTCSKCGQPVLWNQRFRLCYGEIEHTDCDSPAAPLPARTKPADKEPEQ